MIGKTDNPYLGRPARKQVERSLADDCAYKEGDQDYNIWFDKFLTDANVKDKEVNFKFYNKNILIILSNRFLRYMV